MFSQRLFSRRHRVRAAHLSPLRSMRVFDSLSDSALQKVDAVSVELTIAAGTVLVTESERAREAFIVLDGIAEVSTGGVPVSSVGAGDIVGELSLLDGSPRSATVTALTTMRILVLDPRQFRELFTDPQAAFWIASNLAQRLREVHASARLEVLATRA
jgi:CRP-like cAMP-binding protein